MITPASSLALLLSLVLVVAACGGGDGGGGGGDDDSDTEDAGPGGDGDGDGDGDGEACQPGEVPCIDQSISGLMLRDTKSGGTIEAESDEGGVFVSHVDATTGGIMGAGGYTYARFGADGLERVDLSDEEAFESTDWDIAFRRFVIRLNSGVSGPSCVQGARTANNTAFDTLDAVPDNLSFFVEQYFTEGSCEFVADTSGIGAPQTVLGSFWTYPGCVKMTGNVYVVRLASGKHVKLQVLSYYEPTFQETCDTTEMVQMGGNGAANVRMKWAWLD